MFKMVTRESNFRVIHYDCERTAENDREKKKYESYATEKCFLRPAKTENHSNGRQNRDNKLFIA